MYTYVCRANRNSSGKDRRLGLVVSRRGRKSFLFFFIYGEFVRALLDVCLLAREQRSFDRPTHVLSTRSRVEIDKRRVRTSITYLTGALDSFGVKKSLRFPAWYQLSRQAVALLSPFFPSPSPFLITDWRVVASRIPLSQESYHLYLKIVGQVIRVNSEMF